MTARALRSLSLGAALACAACSSVEHADIAPSAPPELTIGELRSVDVRYLRFDVAGFQKTDTLEQLRAMPRRVLQDLWLLDLDARPLIFNALAALSGLPAADVAALTPAAQNMRKLLQMTPDNAELEGTKLAGLVGVSRAIGIPPAKVLADLLGRRISDPFIPPDVVAEVFSRNVISTHPNVQTRKGPVSGEHPDGRWPVPPGYLPLTLADVVTNFEDLAARLGPVADHPGFVLEANGVSVVEDEFAMISKVTANALPFKGIDLTNAEIASVNSIPSQGDTVLDFSDPEWLSMRGLVPEPRIARLGFGVVENPAFIPGGSHKEPVPTGDSPGWALPPWQFERLMLDMAKASVAATPAHCTSYGLGTGVQAFKACIDDTGWVELTSFNGAGDPPPPAYIWDLELELAQVRLHDGNLAEGDADAAITVRDVAVGVSPDEIVEQVRANLQINPEAIEELASLLSGSSTGAADFYYVRGTEASLPQDQADWLFFIAENDIARDQNGNSLRPYAYDRPGFFADPQLLDKVSSAEPSGGDTEHQKVSIEPGDVLYTGDDAERVFRIVVLDKPSRAHVSLQISRVR
jgi:hypothetical protein